MSGRSTTWCGTRTIPPLAVAEGERVELVFVNQTPMPHPMHLHGHEFQVVEIDGERFSGAVRDTVLVTPGPPGGRGVRRQQSGLLGAPLPPALPPRRGHVHDDQVRVTASGLAAGSPHPVLRDSTFSRREKGRAPYPAPIGAAAGLVLAPRRGEPVWPAPLEPIESAIAEAPQRRDVVGQKHEAERNIQRPKTGRMARHPPMISNTPAGNARPAGGGLSQPPGDRLHPARQPAKEPP